jgi:hypothetical protein
LQEALEINNFPLLRSEYDKAIKEIGDLNNLVETRVRLHQAGERGNQNAGKLLLPKLNSESRGRTSIGEVDRKRRIREPFLFAAKCVAPEFLAMDFESTGGKDILITPDALISQVTKKVENRDAFRKLCSAAKAIAPVIDVEWSTEV